ncbi:hypothetical protein QBC41DRAFT_130308 [Cercophora samala]|uniref:Uncharacterized protein n=1 Tax=Cercophora samala TaxID=330535 RepID=A0AA39ZBM5_9PEZI|nr:hypothetical protein QBC41DRAFT_130308 [Cercophora samala]
MRSRQRGDHSAKPEAPGSALREVIDAIRADVDRKGLIGYSQFKPQMDHPSVPALARYICSVPEAAYVLTYTQPLQNRICRPQTNNDNNHRAVATLHLPDGLVPLRPMSRICQQIKIEHQDQAISHHTFQDQKTEEKRKQAVRLTICQNNHCATLNAGARRNVASKPAYCTIANQTFQFLAPVGVLFGSCRPRLTSRLPAGSRCSPTRSDFQLRSPACQSFRVVQLT